MVTIGLEVRNNKFVVCEVVDKKVTSVLAEDGWWATIRKGVKFLTVDEAQEFAKSKGHTDISFTGYFLGGVNNKHKKFYTEMHVIALTPERTVTICKLSSQTGKVEFVITYTSGAIGNCLNINDPRAHMGNLQQALAVGQLFLEADIKLVGYAFEDMTFQSPEFLDSTL